MRANQTRSVLDVYALIGEYSILNPLMLTKPSEWNLKDFTGVILMSTLFAIVLTSSSVGSGWTGWEQEWRCHTVCPEEVNHPKGHLLSLDNHSRKCYDSLYQC